MSRTLSGGGPQVTEPAFEYDVQVRVAGSARARRAGPRRAAGAAVAGRRAGGAKRLGGRDGRTDEQVKG